MTKVVIVVAVLAGKWEVDFLDMTYSHHAIIGSGGYFPIDVKDAMEVMVSKKWDFELIITDEYPWEKLPEAIEKASKVDEALNVIIHF